MSHRRRKLYPYKGGYATIYDVSEETGIPVRKLQYRIHECKETMDEAVRNYNKPRPKFPNGYKKEDLTEKDREIIRLYNCGERSAEEIQKITGAKMSKIRFLIPTPETMSKDDLINDIAEEAENVLRKRKHG